MVDAPEELESPVGFAKPAVERLLVEVHVGEETVGLKPTMTVYPLHTKQGVPGQVVGQGELNLEHRPRVARPGVGSGCEDRIDQADEFLASAGPDFQPWSEF